MKKLIFFFLYSLSLTGMDGDELERPMVESYAVSDIIDSLDTVNIQKDLQNIIVSYLGYIPYIQKEVYIKQEEICKIAFSPNNKLIACYTYSPDSMNFYECCWLDIYDVKTFKLINHMSLYQRIHKTDISITFTTNNNVLLFSSNTDKCILLDIRYTNDILNNKVYSISKFIKYIHINNSDDFYSADKTLLARIIDKETTNLFCTFNKIVQIYKLSSSYTNKEIHPVIDKSFCTIL